MSTGESSEYVLSVCAFNNAGEGQAAYDTVFTREEVGTLILNTSLKKGCILSHYFEFLKRQMDVCRLFLSITGLSIVVCDVVLLTLVVRKPV